MKWRENKWELYNDHHISLALMPQRIPTKANWIVLMSVASTQLCVWRNVARILWMSCSVHSNLIWRHTQASPADSKFNHGGELKQEGWVAYWFWRAGSVIARAQKAVNHESLLLCVYISRRLLHSTETWPTAQACRIMHGAWATDSSSWLGEKVNLS